MRPMLRLIVLAVVLGTVGPGCGKDRTGAHIPTTTAEPKTQPTMPGHGPGGGPTTLIPRK